MHRRETLLYRSGCLVIPGHEMTKAVERRQRRLPHKEVPILHRCQCGSPTEDEQLPAVRPVCQIILPRKLSHAVFRASATSNNV